MSSKQPENVQHSTHGCIGAWSRTLRRERQAELLLLLRRRDRRAERGKNDPTILSVLKRPHSAATVAAMIRSVPAGT